MIKNTCTSKIYLHLMQDIFNQNESIKIVCNIELDDMALKWSV